MSMIQAILETPLRGSCSRCSALPLAESRCYPAVWLSQPVTIVRSGVVHKPQQLIWAVSSSSTIYARNCARSTVDQFTSLNYQTRGKRNATYKACVSKTKGSATLTMSYATRLTSPQEQQEEEIKRGREEQRNANQMRREQMRKEAEQSS
jgi:hypothetical protein